jgi:hypothetical protein
MSLLRADKIANRFNNSGPIIVGPSTVSGNFTVTGILTALGIGVTNNVLVGGGLTAKFITATNSASLFNSSLTGITTAGIITGATYFGDGVNLTGIVTEIQPGPGIQISPISGKGKLTISANGVVVSGYSTNSGLATDVKGGVAGAVLYQVGPNDTGFTASGTTGEILQSQGTASPIWTSLAAINVSYADSAGISTNLKGGSAGRIPYQSGQNQTAFLPIGPTGNLLLGQGTAAPSWIDPKANLDVRYARLSGISTSAIGGVVDTNSLIVSGITTLTGGNVVVDNDLRVSGVTTAANMVVTGVSTIATLNVGTGVGATVGVTTILDEDTFVSNSNEALATQQSIKAYVDAQVTAQDLDGSADNGTFVVDLDSQVLGVVGTTNEIYTIGSGQTVTVGLDTNITIPNNLVVSGFSSLSGLTTITGNLGVTGLTSTQFLTVSGVGTIQTLGVTGVTTTQFLEVTGVSTFGGDVNLGLGITVYNGNFNNTNLTGVTTAETLIVSGITTLTGYVGIGSGLTVTGTGVTATTLNVSGASTVGFLTVTDSLYVSGIASVGAAVTMYGNTGIISATAFYGDGSNLTGVVGLVSVTNQIYVTPDGNDENDGYLISSAKRTVGSALTIAEASTVIRISAGNYSENNPIILPEQVTLLGDSLREVSIIPQNPDEDLIYVANGSYVENMTFTGTLNEGKAIIAFNPNKPSYVTQGPYIRNCTNFISNSIGMKIDGRHVIGDTRAMNVDSYTQLNQGGIGVSVSNEGYAQLVSIFTIYNDQSIVCIDGGQCDLTNSNSSFGRLGLVADGIGPTNFIGTVTEFTSAGSNVFPIDIGVDSINITNATYDNVTGLTTITTATNHGYNVGMSVSMKDMTFTCDSQLPVTSFGISTANYSNITGVMTVSTSIANNFYVGASVTFSQLVFSCDSGGGVSTAYFPPAPGDNNGAINYVFDVVGINSAREFEVNVGPSTIVHNYQTGGNVSISTFAPFPSGAFGNIFTVDSVPATNQFRAYVGVSTLAHTYSSGGQVETFTSLPYDGQVVYLDSIYNTIKGVKITSGGSGYTTPPTVTFSDPSESWGIKATGVARLTGGSVTSVDMISNGRGYTGTPTVSFTGSATGTPDILPTYYVVSSATPVVGGITTVTFTENVPYAVGVGTTVPFFKQSRVLASSQAFEYIGSGNTALTALPQRGGIAIPENEIVNKNGGLVIFTSTDQAGNFKIGEGVIINQLEGSITGDAYNRSLFANITPYILALGGDS